MITLTPMFLQHHKSIVIQKQSMEYLLQRKSKHLQSKNLIIYIIQLDVLCICHSNIVSCWVQYYCQKLVVILFLSFGPVKSGKVYFNCWTANNIFHSLYIPTAACNLNSYSEEYFCSPGGGIKCKMHVHCRLHFRMNF